MLAKLRERKTAKKIFWALIILIIPVFLFWGIRMSSEKSVNISGKIYGEDVSYKEYTNAYNAVKSQALMLYKENFSKIAKFLNLRQEAWKRLILIKEAKKQKITIPDVEVIATIQNIELFQRNGVFSEELYNRIIGYSFQTKPRDFEEEMRDSLKIKKLHDLVTSKISISEDEIKEAIKKDLTEYKITYIRFNIMDFVPKKEDAKEKPQYTKEELEKAIQEARTKAEEALNKIKDEKGSKFEETATKLGYKVEETDYFKTNAFLQGVGTTDEFSEACSNLKSGEIGKLVMNQSSYFVFCLKDIKTPKEDTLKEQEGMKEKYLSQKKEAAFREFFDKTIQEANPQENPKFFERFRIQ